MVYDTIIIGGGLSALICGIRLKKAGQSVAIISTGQSALHFNAGVLSLFSSNNGKDVLNPLEEIASLPETHPYSKVGTENVGRLALGVKEIMNEAGISLYGDATRNHYRLTPVGLFKPAWLTMKGYVAVDNPDDFPWRKVAIVNFKGYIDFYPEFLAAGLQKKRIDAIINEITVTAVDKLRAGAREMRATGIAGIINQPTVDDIAEKLNEIVAKHHPEAIIMPAVIGLTDETPIDNLQEKVPVPIKYIPTTPMSLGGMRAQLKLQHHFKKLGGIYLLGDTVTGGNISENRVISIDTGNLGGMSLKGDQFVLATGSFFSHGLEATVNEIIEPIFGLDVDAPTSRDEWHSGNFYDRQPYMKFGVITDKEFFTYKNGERISNLRAIGAVLSGHDALKEGSGAGVATITALHVAENILKR